MELLVAHGTQVLVAHGTQVLLGRSAVCVAGCFVEKPFIFSFRWQNLRRLDYICPGLSALQSCGQKIVGHVLEKTAWCGSEIGSNNSENGHACPCPTMLLYSVYFSEKRWLSEHVNR